MTDANKTPPPYKNPRRVRAVERQHWTARMSRTSLLATTSMLIFSLVCIAQSDEARDNAVQAVLHQYFVPTNGTPFRSGYVYDKDMEKSVPIVRALIATNHLRRLPEIPSLPFPVVLYTNTDRALRIEVGDLYIKVARIAERTTNHFDISLYTTGRGFIGGLTIQYDVVQEGDSFRVTPVVYLDP